MLRFGLPKLRGQNLIKAFSNFWDTLYSFVTAVKKRFLWKLSDNVYLPAYALAHTWHIPEGVLELMWLEGPPPPPLPQRAARRAPDSHGNRTTLLTTTGWQNWFRLVFKCSVTSLLTYPQWLSLFPSLQPLLKGWGAQRTSCQRLRR